MARTYHMLGLVHLAIPFYLQTLQEAIVANEKPLLREDLVIDAAYSLRTIYSVAGNSDLAHAVTEKWLILE